MTLNVKFLSLLTLLGILLQATLLIAPSGFNSDAAASSLLAYDMISNERWIFSISTFHTKEWLVFPISPITPIIPVFLIFGFVDWGVRFVIVFYNLLAAFFLYRLTDLWFDKKTAKIALILFLFSPWVMNQFNLWVPTAALFTVMPIYIHQVAIKEKKYLPLAYVLLGLSFYFFMTAKIIILFYLLLFFLSNSREFFEKKNIFSFMLFLVTVLPWMIYSFFLAEQAELIFRPDPGFPEVIDIVYLFILMTPFLFIAFTRVFDTLRRLVSGKKTGFADIFLAGWLLSFFFALILAPWSRPRVAYHSVPAFIILSSYAYTRMPKDKLYIILLAFAFAGSITHGFLYFDSEYALKQMGFEYGLDQITDCLMANNVSWIYTDFRMDKQILFYSQRKLPLTETCYPKHDSPTFPWLEHAQEHGARSGSTYYVFWADHEHEKYFLENFEGYELTCWADYPWGERAINTYRIR